MKKTRKTCFTAALLCAVLCFGFILTGCGETAVYPAFRNPVNNNPSENPDGSFNGKYTISVVSAGGLPLNGVRISAKKDGNTIAWGISKNGVIELSLAADE